MWLRSINIALLVCTIILNNLAQVSYADCVQGDCKNGYGWWEWANGDRYFGFFKKMRRHGLGAFYSESGSRYEGAWLNDTKDGHGTWTWADGTRYTGKWSKDVHHGHGIYLFSGGEMYEGDYHLGKRHGHGINTWPSGDRYEGNFVLDKRKGHGRLLSTSGSLFEGNWDDDLIQGYGCWMWQNGNLYQGQWLNGERSGYGVYLWSDGTKHMGQWHASKENGLGIRVQMGLLWGNKTTSGRWKDGKLQNDSEVISNNFFDSISNVLLETSEGHDMTRSVADTALDSANQARAAAREAMTLARAAQAISRSKIQNVQDIGCSPLPAFTQGEVHPSLSSYQQGDVVSLSCSAGYQLVGGFPARECNLGQWAGGGTPACVANTELIASERVKSTFSDMFDWIRTEKEKSDPSSTGGGSNFHKKFPASTSPSETLQSKSAGMESHHPSNQRNGDTDGMSDSFSGSGGKDASVSRFLTSCGLNHLEASLLELAPSLDALLVVIIRQSELEQAGVWKRDQRSLLSCTKDYLLRNITYGN